MTGHPYSVEIKSLSDANCDVVFSVTPPIEFATEESRQALSRTVLNLVCRRADQRDDVLNTGIVEFTHDLPSGNCTMGYARIKTLRYGSGNEIFTQALLTALNGEHPDLYSDGPPPWERPVDF
jgi:hypothetical protein